MRTLVILQNSSDSMSSPTILLAVGHSEDRRSMVTECSDDLYGYWLCARLHAMCIVAIALVPQGNIQSIRTRVNIVQAIWLNDGASSCKCVSLLALVLCVYRNRMFARKSSDTKRHLEIFHYNTASKGKITLLRFVFVSSERCICMRASDNRFRIAAITLWNSIQSQGLLKRNEKTQRSVCDLVVGERFPELTKFNLFGAR